MSAKACKKERRQRNVKKRHTRKVYNCIQKSVDILYLAGIIRKRKAKALEATAQSVSSGAFFIHPFMTKPGRSVFRLEADTERPGAECGEAAASTLFQDQSL